MEAGPGGAITAGAALYYTQHTATASLVIGSGDGTVYTLDQSTGQVKKTYKVVSPVVGVTNAASFIVVSTAGGTVDGLKPGNLGWRYKSPSGLASAPTVLNGIIYVAGEDYTREPSRCPGDRSHDSAWLWSVTAPPTRKTDTNDADNDTDRRRRSAVAEGYRRIR